MATPKNVSHSAGGSHAGEPHEHITPLSVYLGVFGALMVLTVVTVVISELGIPEPWNLVVAMIVAILLGFLVGRYFTEPIVRLRDTALVLAEGDACVVGDTGSICDSGAGMFCLENEFGGVTCEDPARLQCLVRTAMLPGQVATATTVSDVSQGSCGGGSTSEVVFTYTVQNPMANLVLFGPAGPTAVYARADCADADTELACATSNNLKVLDVRQGEDITIFAEAPTDTSVSLAVLEEMITILDEGDPCDPSSDTDLCDMRDGVGCYEVEGSDICFRPVVLAEGAACEPGSLTHLCDTDDGVYCLDVDGEDTCFRPVTLSEGDACTPGSLTHICDPNLTLVCTDPDGNGDVCFDTNIDNDTCDTATPLTGSGTMTVPLLYANNDYNASDYDVSATDECTGYSSNGPDVVFSVALQAGQTLTATHNSSVDDSMYILDRCPTDGAVCLDGSDLLSGSEPEEVSYTASSAETVFLIVDVYSSTGMPTSTSLTWDIQ